MPDMTGKTILVTGATNGIGRATVEQLAPMGGRIVLVGRDEAKCQEVVASLAHTPAQLSYLVADLSSQAEIKALAAAFLAEHSELHLLLNNAGAYFTERELTVDGLERTFALNHVGYYLLTHLLLDVLKASAPSRVVNVASDAHKGGKVDWDDLQREHWTQAGWPVYAQSKLLNILFTKELARRLEGTGVTANCLHPGFVSSGFARNNGFLGNLMMTLTRPLQRTTTKSARGVVTVATAPELATTTGTYFADGKPAPCTKRAQNMDDAKRLWDVTAALTGVDATAA